MDTNISIIRIRWTQSLKWQNQLQVAKEVIPVLENEYIFMVSRLTVLVKVLQ